MRARRRSIDGPAAKHTFPVAISDAGLSEFRTIIQLTSPHGYPIPPLTLPQKQTAADPPVYLPVYLPLILREAIESALNDSSVIRLLNGGVNLASIAPTDTLIAAQRIAPEQGRFQPKLSANYDASHIDQPPNAFFGPGIAADTRRDATSASARVTQPLKTGGSLSLGIEPPLAYLFLGEWQ